MLLEGDRFVSSLMDRIDPELPPVAETAPPRSTVRKERHLWARDLRVGSGVLFFGILAIAAVLRFVFLSQNSVWRDEAVVVWVAKFRWHDLLPVLRLRDVHPPLYFILMKAWIGKAGTGEAAIRIPSAIFSLLSVVLTYFLARWVAPEPTSLLSAFLVAVAPLQIMIGQDAGTYALLGMLAVGSTFALLWSVVWGGYRWFVYLSLITLMVYTDYLGFLVLIAQGIWMALYERANLRRWLVSLGFLVLLYVLWVPSLTVQLTHQFAFSRHALLGLDGQAKRLGGLFGLFAFGGSLFGMPSLFFADSPRGPVEQFLILLPFLVVLWRGIASFDRSNLALIGCAFLVPIVVVFTLPLEKPAPDGRWFSYLVPFYATILARGIVDLSQAFRERQDRVLAVLTALLLAYSIPVLFRYYFDPDFRPFQYRAAAALVAKWVKPGDMFVYEDDTNSLAFSYYFPRHTPQLYLLPNPDFKAVRGLAGRYQRVWLILTSPMDDTTLTQMLSELRGSYRFAGENSITGTPSYPWVYLFEAKPRGAR